MLQLSITTRKHWQRPISFLHGRINSLSNAPVCQVAIAMNSNSASNGSFAENPFGFRQVDLRDFRRLRGGQASVHHDTTDNCRFYVTTMKVTNFKDDILPIPIDSFNYHYIAVFDVTSMQDATEHSQYP